MNIIKQIKLPYYIYVYYIFKKACDDEMYLVCSIDKSNCSHFRTTLLDNDRSYRLMVMDSYSILLYYGIISSIIVIIISKVIS